MISVNVEKECRAAALHRASLHAAAAEPQPAEQRRKVSFDTGHTLASG